MLGDGGGGMWFLLLFVVVVEVGCFVVCIYIFEYFGVWSKEC